jgi:GDP/UDP-N,N'-diacetylbacillosamine 2-epimerase (hydrolysing)
MNSKRIKIIATTGIRSEYHILYPVINKLRSNGHQVKLIISGAHLSAWHGSSMKKIEEDGFEIADNVDCLFSTNRTTQRVKGIGSLLTGISQCVEREKPDLLIYVGDREEGIATALVANYMDILFAHLSGGDPVWGNADDPIRFAISKLAHIHFPFATDYANNLRKIGEEDFRIFHSGNPSLDNIKHTKKISIQQLSKNLNYELKKENYIVLIQHPLSSEKSEAGFQMRKTLESVKKFCIKYNYKAVGIYPNTDPGSYDILDAIEEYKDLNIFGFFKNLSHSDFVNLMTNASALIGNSSMGILEAPFYKLPVVNVGKRQSGRLNAGNVEFVDYDENIILTALERACFDEKYRKIVKKLNNPYGQGNASEIIVNVIENINYEDRKWYVKRGLC